VFRDQVPSLFSDFFVKEAYSERFSAILDRWTECCDMLPVSWQFVDPELTVPVDFSVDDFHETLQLALQPQFWEVQE
jgi:hypothetical protein